MVAPIFASTGGTITAGGVFTAGATAGTYAVTATAQGRSGTAAVTITPAPIGYNWIMGVYIFLLILAPIGYNWIMGVLIFPALPAPITTMRPRSWWRQLPHWIQPSRNMSAERTAAAGSTAAMAERKRD